MIIKEVSVDILEEILSNIDSSVRTMFYEVDLVLISPQHTAYVMVGEASMVYFAKTTVGSKQSWIEQNFTKIYDYRDA